MVLVAAIANSNLSKVEVQIIFESLMKDTFFSFRFKCLWSTRKISSIEKIGKMHIK